VHKSKLTPNPNQKARIRARMLQS